MFNMGGPIKQGIMDGIREPYAGGGRAGAGLVGTSRHILKQEAGNITCGFYYSIIRSNGNTMLKICP